MKSRWMRWAGHVAHKNLKGRDHLEDLDFDGWILKWTLGK
jgi:hypothetical protein